ncbi:MAG: hypothetical protein WBN04_17200 [Paracoccaceae bacterium]
MYARVTPFKMKPGSKAAATKLVNDLKSQIMALPGIQQFINVIDDSGAGYVISLTDVKTATPETNEKIKEIWSGFAHHLEAMPTASTYDMIANWKN